VVKHRYLDSMLSSYKLNNDALHNRFLFEDK